MTKGNTEKQKPFAPSLWMRIIMYWGCLRLERNRLEFLEPKKKAYFLNYIIQKVLWWHRICLQMSWVER